MTSITQSPQFPPNMFDDPKNAFMKVHMFLTKLDEFGRMMGDKRIYESILRSRMLHHTLDRVEIKPSPLHGFGVFAKEDIDKGEFVTFYPADAWKTGDLFQSNHTLDVIGDPKAMMAYQIGIGEIEIFGNPKNIDDPSYLGHMINDAAKFSPGGDLREYLTQSLGHRNVEAYVVGNYNHLSIVAMRSIKRGEEILMSYGPKYWMNLEHNLTNVVFQPPK